MEPGFVWRSAAFAVALLSCSVLEGAQAGPFTPMSGNWSGNGTLTMANGAQDRLRCLAKYLVGQGGGSLRLNIRCASDNYRFDLVSTVTTADGKISGDWRETSRNAQGTVTGRTTGERIDIEARSELFTAALSLTTSRDRQSVTIVPQGTEVSKVSLSLSKR